MGSLSQEPLRDAIIFIAGLERTRSDRLYDPDVLARRIAAELDRNRKGAPGQFVVVPPGMDESRLGSARQAVTVRKRMIVRRLDGHDCPAIDLFVFDCNSLLRDPLERQSLFVQAARLLLAILASIPRLVRLARNSDKGLNHVFQLGFGLLGLALFAAYFLILIVAALQTILAIPQVTKAFGAGPAAMILTLPQFVVVLTAVAQALVPNLTNTIRTLAIDYLAMVSYLTIGENRDVIAGQFADLTDYLAGQNLYRRVSVIAFSFGSLAALDILFPSSRLPAPRTEAVHSLVTIGCPHDLVQSILPDYYRDRQLLPGKPTRWINVYSPVDVLASKLSEADKRGEPRTLIEVDCTHLPPGTRVPIPENIEYTSGIAQKDLNLFDWLTLVGLRAHCAYWQDKPEIELSCFHQIVGALYRGDPLLA